MTKRLIVPLALALLLAAGSAQAGSIAGSPTGLDPFNLYFNENGVGQYSQNGGPLTNDPGQQVLDTNTGLTQLSYLLPEAVVTGAVGITDANGTTLSDVIDFFQGVDGNYYMAYYSGDTNGGQAADTGIPAQFQNGNVFIGASEDANGNFSWFPGGNEYFGVSPETATTPEPTSLSLAGLTGLCFFVGRRLRRRSAV